VTPLALSTAVPARGDLVLFVGRSDRGGDAQVASVSKIGRCPSLPAVPNAVFTSIEARPGDSGAPLLDAQVRVIGLVHGGARCHIAAPVASLARQLEEEEGPPCVEAQAGAIRSTEVRCSELQLLQDTATAL
jgi:hypothetical protein